MGILKKRISELSKNDKKAALKPLGVKGRPYPMKGIAFVDDLTGKKVFSNFLGVIEDDTKPIKIYSDRSYGEVLGLAMRDMPTPGMLSLFYDAVNRRRPENKRRIQFLIGPAGLGKTYMSELIARMGREEGALKIDCGNLNLNELLFETVLDIDRGTRFYDKIDAKIQAYNENVSDEAARNKILNPLSVAILKEHLGEAFDEDRQGRICIDWHRIGGNNLKKQNGDGYIESSKSVKTAYDGLMMVAKKEGLEDLAQNALGMAMQEGALITAWKEGREIILDEFNRAKEGTTRALHGVLQFLAGETDECTVFNTLKEKNDKDAQSFTFNRKDQRLAFFCTLTGNTTADGDDVDEMPESLSSRIIPQFLADPTEEDWQHRWCQFFVGLPVSTIYKSAETQWKKDGEAFGRKLLEWREGGLSPDEQKNIPEIHKFYLGHWQDVLGASENMAKFMSGASQIVNPDSRLHQTGSLNALMDEISDSFKKELAVDFRKIKYFMDEASHGWPEIKTEEESSGYDTGRWDEPPVLSEDLDQEDITLKMGTYLQYVVLKWVVENTISRGKHALYHQLMSHAADCGIIEPELYEGRRGNRKTLTQLLDKNPYESNRPDVRAEYVRNLLCNHLRALYPDVVEKNDSLMSVHMVDNVLKDLEKEDMGQNIAVFNEDRAAFYNDPLVKVYVQDALLQDDLEKDMKAKDLLSQNVLLSSLSAPVLRHKNLKTIWNEAISGSGSVAKGHAPYLDDSLAMAENTSKTGLAVTSVMLGEKTEAQSYKKKSVHIIWNTEKDKLLIVGEGKIDSFLKKAFNLSGAVYIDRTNTDAVKQINKALKTTIGVKGKQEEKNLKGAFLMRNKASASSEKTSSLAELMAAKETKCYLPNYITNSPA